MLKDFDMNTKSTKIRIIVQTDGFNKLIPDYLNFNLIPHCEKDFYDTTIDTYGRHLLGNDIVESDSTLLVLTHHVFYEMCSWPTSKDMLVKFSKNNNKIWIYDNGDTFSRILPNHKQVLDLDKEVPSGVIKIFIDGQLSDLHALNSLKNIKLVRTPYPWYPYLHMPRLFQSDCNKIDCQRDFLLTMAKKKNRPHRQVLFNQLKAVDGLIERGHFRYGTKEHRNTLIGMLPTGNDWFDGHPSMDLYLDSWLEIVPEQLYKHGYNLTEKTVKPMATKTPFLAVSTCGYLEFVKQFGFQTFHSIIDERYDKQYKIQDRVKLMLEQLQDIIRNGSESFYQACQPILEHNQARLLEITGRKVYDTDLFIKNHLVQDGVL